MLNIFKKNKKDILIMVITLLFFLLSKLTWADTVNIENDISASANTGGNTAQNGENIKSGDASVNIRVNQNVNGTSLPPININEYATGGNSINVQVDRVYTGSDYDSKTRINAEVNSGPSKIEGKGTTTPILKKVSTSTEEKQIIESVESTSSNSSTSAKQNNNTQKLNFFSWIIKKANSFLSVLTKKISIYFEKFI